MKRFLPSLVMSLVLVFSASTTANAADVAPPTNVNCSITLSGAQCSASITSTGSPLTYAISKTEWYVSILTPGAPPTDVSSYSPPIFVKSTEPGVSIGASVSIGAGVTIGTGSVDLNYETLLGFTKNDIQGTVLISARTFNSANEATPFFGQRSYLALTEVKALMATAKATADSAVAKVTADKVFVEGSEIATAAANDATDAALSAAEAAEAATAMAQEAVDAVAELSAQVASLMSELKTQITLLSNLVVKIQKKVRN